MVKHWTVAFTALLVSTSMSPAAVAGSYEDGVRDYNRGLYQQAVVELARASGAQPNRSIIHYYLANALVRLNQHQAAADEYRMGYATADTQELGQNCRKALTAYGQPIPDDKQVKALRKSLQTPATASGAGQRDVIGVAGSPALEATLAVIRRQVEIEKRKDESISNVTAEDAMASAQQEIQAVRNKADADVARLYTSNSKGHVLDPSEIAIQEQSIRNTAKDREDLIMRQAQEKADRYKHIGEMKKSALDEVADNLQHQMSDSGHISGVKLLPQGTDLYVRQYRSVQTARAVPDAHPAVARIYAQRAGDNNSALSATADSIHADQIKSSTSVHAKLLKQPQ